MDAMKEALKRKRARGLDLTILLDAGDKGGLKEAGLEDQDMKDEMNEKTSDLAPEVLDESDEMQDGPFAPEEVAMEKNEAQEALDHNDPLAAKSEMDDMKNMSKHMGPGFRGHGLKGAAHKHWMSKLLKK